MPRQGLFAAIAALGLLGACAAGDQDFSAAPSETVEVDGQKVTIRVVKSDNAFMVLAGDSGADGYLWRTPYSDAAPARHATYLAAAKAALASRCDAGKAPYMRNNSPVPWEPFVGRFICL